MTAITKERFEELRGYLQNHAKEPREWWISTDEANDLIAILDSYSSLRAEIEALIKGHVKLLEAEKYLRGRCTEAEAENERLNTWHCTLSEAWKARADKAEARLAKVCERNKLMDENFGSLLEKNIKLEAQLAKQAPLVEAAMRARLVKFSNTDIGGYEPHVQRILRSALKLREEKK